MADPLDCALDLMRRLPPSQTEENLSGLIDLVPDLVEDLLSAVDQPLKVAHDKGAKRDYLLCDYNRDGNSYRSPWSNKYDPPLRDGALPSDVRAVLSRALLLFLTFLCRGFAISRLRRIKSLTRIVSCILRAACLPSTVGIWTRDSPQCV